MFYVDNYLLDLVRFELFFFKSWVMHYNI